MHHFLSIYKNVNYKNVNKNTILGNSKWYFWQKKIISETSFGISDQNWFQNWLQIWILTIFKNFWHFWSFLKTYCICMQENELISACILGWKISWFQLVFLAIKSSDFSSFSWLEYQLISASNLGWKMSWFQLVFFAKKSADFSSFS